MLKFNKVLSSRIVSLIIACVFLLTNTAYGIDLSEKSHLRKPLDLNKNPKESRIHAILNRLTKRAPSPEKEKLREDIIRELLMKSSIKDLVKKFGVERFIEIIDSVELWSLPHIIIKEKTISDREDLNTRVNDLVKGVELIREIIEDESINLEQLKDIIRGYGGGDIYEGCNLLNQLSDVISKDSVEDLIELEKIERNLAMSIYYTTKNMSWILEYRDLLSRYGTKPFILMAGIIRKNRKEIYMGGAVRMALELTQTLDEKKIVEHYGIEFLIASLEIIKSTLPMKLGSPLGKGIKELIDETIDYLSNLHTTSPTRADLDNQISRGYTFNKLDFTALSKILGYTSLMERYGLQIFILLTKYRNLKTAIEYLKAIERFIAEFGIDKLLDLFTKPQSEFSKFSALLTFFNSPNANEEQKESIVNILLIAGEQGSRVAGDILYNLFNSPVSTSETKTIIISGLSVEMEKEPKSQILAQLLEHLTGQLEKDFFVLGHGLIYRTHILNTLRIGLKQNIQPAIETIERLVPTLVEIISNPVEPTISKTVTEENDFRIAAIKAFTKMLIRKSSFDAEYNNDLEDATIDLLSFGIDCVALQGFVELVIDKKDKSGVNTLHEITRGIEIDTSYLDILNTVFKREAKYETKRDVLTYLVDIFSIIDDYDAIRTKENTKKVLVSFKETIREWDQHLIGDKRFLNNIRKASHGFKNALLEEIIEKKLSDEESEKIWQGEGERLSNLLGLYFHIFQTEDNEVTDKVVMVLNKWVEFKGDTTKVNGWLYQEADWNKDEFKRLTTEKGYSLSLWSEEGIVIEEEVSSQGAGETLKQISQQTHQLIEIAESLKIAIPEIIKKNGINSYGEAQTFVDEIIRPNTNNPEVLSNLSRILEETKRLESVYKDTTVRKDMVRIEIRKDFFEDANSGVGIPGCFNPLTGGEKQTPLIHSLETNSFFLRVYMKGKMVANAVIVLTDEGAVIFGLYNATNFALNKVVFEAIKELTRDVPKVLMVKESASYSEAITYGIVEQTLAKKREIVTDDPYYDFGEYNREAQVTNFNMTLSLTQKMIEEKGGFKETEKRIRGEQDRKEKSQIIWDRLARLMIEGNLKDYLFIIGALKKEKIDLRKITKEIIVRIITNKGLEIKDEDVDTIFAIINKLLSEEYGIQPVDLNREVERALEEGLVLDSQL